MKIYFNRRPVGGPWGGGSKVLNAITQECRNRGHELFFEEQIQKDVDVIFCFDPRSTQKVGYDDLRRQKSDKNVLIQRVGDLGTHGKPELFDLVSKTAPIADKVIFPSNWALNFLKSRVKLTNECLVIKNAPLENFFVHRNSHKNFTDKIRIVSHHWSDNVMKGFEVYEELDRFCERNKERYDFTFIGRKPSSLNLKNYIEPQDIEGLIRILPSHHVYITASKREAGANHVLEALALGLPVLYHIDGGSINEYCQDYGISYKNSEDLIKILEEKLPELDRLQREMNFTRSSVQMAKEYVDMFEESYHESQHKH